MEQNKQMSREAVAVEYIIGARPVPEYARKLVEEYNLRAEAIRGARSYPRHVQQEMDQLYDALVVIAR